ncbi:Predicted PurR-regulated permease PerM [Flavobacterium fluvii]|uniref:Predicted PurR-regulated permease PerM n=1 Tax=Flavobacterium fluvii TaxID=468056 RepID=A0A1M5N4J5_9FLAO|nr:AI-2E family transporter [Flavobacterium fluvii]SHG84375.1 Predicted PurR-regulated permease PerM [Flavobacterium fluvii]
MPIPETPVQINSNKKFSVNEILLFIVLACILLYFGKTLLIPLSFAMLISFIMYPVCKWMEKKGISQNIAIFISIFGLMLFFALLVYLLFMQIVEFSNEWENFKIKLLEAANQLSLFFAEQLDFSIEKQTVFLENVINNSGTEAISLLKITLSSISESLFYLLIIPVYSVLILYYRQLLVNALYQVFPPEKKQIIHEILVETIHAYHNFIKGMLLVYLIVGILNSLGLLLIGIPHPFLFGFMASILTFIPYVGIIVSSLLPIMISWITYNSIWYPIGVIVVFSVVQILEAYIIFPFAVGGRLKINTLVVLIMIIVGGILWGAVGMILFIPFISIVKLIADRSESLKIVSLLMGEKEKKKKK